MNQLDLTQKPWWSYLDESQQDLLSQSVKLLQREEDGTLDSFHDYSFIVFPAAKAYEGFLKKLLFDLQIINEYQYKGRHFRIGKALNPSIEDHLKDGDWIYENLKSECSESTPQDLWEAWKTCRNAISHWFPGHQNMLSLPEARERVELIVSTIDKAFVECNIKSDK